MSGECRTQVKKLTRDAEGQIYRLMNLNVVSLQKSEHDWASFPRVNYKEQRPCVEQSKQYIPPVKPIHRYNDLQDEPQDTFKDSDKNVSDEAESKQIRLVDGCSSVGLPENGNRAHASEQEVQDYESKFHENEMFSKQNCKSNSDDTDLQEAGKCTESRLKKEEGETCVPQVTSDSNTQMNLKFPQARDDQPVESKVITDEYMLHDTELNVAHTGDDSYNSEGEDNSGDRHLDDDINNTITYLKNNEIDNVEEEIQNDVCQSNVVDTSSYCSVTESKVRNKNEDDTDSIDLDDFEFEETADKLAKFSGCSSYDDLFTENMNVVSSQYDCDVENMLVEDLRNRTPPENGHYVMDVLRADEESFSVTNSLTMTSKSGELGDFSVVLTKDGAETKLTLRDFKTETNRTHSDGCFTLSDGDDEKNLNLIHEERDRITYGVDIVMCEESIVDNNNCDSSNLFVTDEIDSFLPSSEGDKDQRSELTYQSKDEPFSFETITTPVRFLNQCEDNPHTYNTTFHTDNSVAVSGNTQSTSNSDTKQSSFTFNSIESRNLKCLSRNPSSQWQRLVDDNIQSMVARVLPTKFTGNCKDCPSLINQNTTHISQAKPLFLLWDESKDDINVPHLSGPQKNNSVNSEGTAVPTSETCNTVDALLDLQAHDDIERQLPGNNSGDENVLSCHSKPNESLCSDTENDNHNVIITELCQTDADENRDYEIEDEVQVNENGFHEDEMCWAQDYRSTSEDIQGAGETTSLRGNDEESATCISQVTCDFNTQIVSKLPQALDDNLGNSKVTPDEKGYVIQLNVTQTGSANDNLDDEDNSIDKHARENDNNRMTCVRNNKINAVEEDIQQCACQSNVMDTSSYCSVTESKVRHEENEDEIGSVDLDDFEFGETTGKQATFNGRSPYDDLFSQNRHVVSDQYDVYAKNVFLGDLDIETLPTSGKKCVIDILTAEEESISVPDSPTMMSKCSKSGDFNIFLAKDSGDARPIFADFETGTNDKHSDDCVALLEGDVERHLDLMHPDEKDSITYDVEIVMSPESMVNKAFYDSSNLLITEEKERFFLDNKNYNDQCNELTYQSKKVPFGSQTVTIPGRFLDYCEGNPQTNDATFHIDNSIVVSGHTQSTSNSEIEQSRFSFNSIETKKLKCLSRNPFSQWQRLVDDNIQSMVARVLSTKFTVAYKDSPALINQKKTHTLQAHLFSSPRDKIRNDMNLLNSSSSQNDNVEPEGRTDEVFKTETCNAVNALQEAQAQDDIESQLSDKNSQDENVLSCHSKSIVSLCSGTENEDDMIAELCQTDVKLQDNKNGTLEIQNTVKIHKNRCQKNDKYWTRDGTVEIKRIGNNTLMKSIVEDNSASVVKVPSNSNETITLKPFEDQLYDPVHGEETMENKTEAAVNRCIRPSDVDGNITEHTRAIDKSQSLAPSMSSMAKSDIIISSNSFPDMRTICKTVSGQDTTKFVEHKIKAFSRYFKGNTFKMASTNKYLFPTALNVKAFPSRQNTVSNDHYLPQFVETEDKKSDQLVLPVDLPKTSKGEQGPCLLTTNISNQVSGANWPNDLTCVQIPTYRESADPNVSAIDNFRDIVALRVECREENYIKKEKPTLWRRFHNLISKVFKQSLTNVNSRDIKSRNQTKNTTFNFHKGKECVSMSDQGGKPHKSFVLRQRNNAASLDEGMSGIHGGRQNNTMDITRSVHRASKIPVRINVSLKMAFTPGSNTVSKHGLENAKACKTLDDVVDGEVGVDEAADDTSGLGSSLYGCSLLSSHRTGSKHSNFRSSGDLLNGRVCTHFTSKMENTEIDEAYSETDTLSGISEFDESFNDVVQVQSNGMESKTTLHTNNAEQLALRDRKFFVSTELQNNAHYSICQKPLLYVKDNSGETKKDDLFKADLAPSEIISAERLQVIPVISLPVSTVPRTVQPFYNDVTSFGDVTISVSNSVTSQDVLSWTNNEESSSQLNDCVLKTSSSRAQQDPSASSLEERLEKIVALVDTNQGPIVAGLEGRTTSPHVMRDNEDSKGGDLLQSSLECMLEMLLQRGKVLHAFIANTEGEVLAKTVTLQVQDSDVHNLFFGLTSNYSGMVKMAVFGDIYTCFKYETDSSLIGRTDRRVLVAHHGKQNMVVGLSDTSSPGSCIREIQELSQVLSHRGL